MQYIYWISMIKMKKAGEFQGLKSWYNIANIKLFILFTTIGALSGCLCFNDCDEGETYFNFQIANQNREIFVPKMEEIKLKLLESEADSIILFSSGDIFDFYLEFPYLDFYKFELKVEGFKPATIVIITSMVKSRCCGKILSQDKVFLNGALSTQWPRILFLQLEDDD